VELDHSVIQPAIGADVFLVAVFLVGPMLGLVATGSLVPKGAKVML